MAAAFQVYTRFNANIYNTMAAHTLYIYVCTVIACRAKCEIYGAELNTRPPRIHSMDIERDSLMKNRIAPIPKTISQIAIWNTGENISSGVYVNGAKQEREHRYRQNDEKKLNKTLQKYRRKQKEATAQTHIAARRISTRAKPKKRKVKIDIKTMGQIAFFLLRRQTWLVWMCVLNLYELPT